MITSTYQIVVVISQVMVGSMAVVVQQVLEVVVGAMMFLQCSICDQKESNSYHVPVVYASII